MKANIFILFMLVTRLSTLPLLPRPLLDHPLLIDALSTSITTNITDSSRWLPGGISRITSTKNVTISSLQLTMGSISGSTTVAGRNGSSQESPSPPMPRFSDTLRTIPLTRLSIPNTYPTGLYTKMQLPLNLTTIDSNPSTYRISEKKKHKFHKSKSCKSTTCQPTTCPITICQVITCPPTTCKPTTCRSTTCESTTCQSTTCKPTTCRPTTCKPTTCQPTTCKPTTCKPTTCKPTTCKPTTCKSTTCKPTTCMPTTCKPTTCKPTTCKPTTCKPTTCKPTTCKPTTCKSTTCTPTICRPTTCRPTYCRPTTCRTTTCKPTTCTTTCKPMTCRTTTCKPMTCRTTTCKPTTCRTTTCKPKVYSVTICETSAFYLSSNAISYLTPLPSLILPTSLPPPVVSTTYPPPTTFIRTSLQPTTPNSLWTSLQPTTPKSLITSGTIMTSISPVRTASIDSEPNKSLKSTCRCGKSLKPTCSRVKTSRSSIAPLTRSPARQSIGMYPLSPTPQTSTLLNNLAETIFPIFFNNSSSNNPPTSLSLTSDAPRSELPTSTLQISNLNSFSTTSHYSLNPTTSETEEAETTSPSSPLTFSSEVTAGSISEEKTEGGNHTDSLATISSLFHNDTENTSAFNFNNVASQQESIFYEFVEMVSEKYSPDGSVYVADGNSPLFVSDAKATAPNIQGRNDNEARATFIPVTKQHVSVSDGLKSDINAIDNQVTVVPENKSMNSETQNNGYLSEDHYVSKQLASNEYATLLSTRQGNGTIQSNEQYPASLPDIKAQTPENVPLIAKSIANQVVQPPINLPLQMESIPPIPIRENYMQNCPHLFPATVSYNFNALPLTSANNFNKFPMTQSCNCNTHTITPSYNYNPVMNGPSFNNNSYIVI